MDDDRWRMGGEKMEIDEDGEMDGGFEYEDSRRLV